MAHRKPTPEQQAKAQERRDRFHNLVKQVAALAPEQQQALAMQCWPSTVEQHPLSVTNACLIALQMPSATIVGGFRQWIKVGRAVRKGEHGLAIWVPSGAPKLGEGFDRTSDNGDGEGADIRFLMGTVFDVSQTIEIAASEAA